GIRDFHVTGVQTCALPISALAETATQTLSAVGVDNVVTVVGSLPAGWPSEGPYDAILLSGAVPEVPSALLDQLKDGGRLAAVVRSEERRVGEECLSTWAVR